MKALRGDDPRWGGQHLLEAEFAQWWDDFWFAQTFPDADARRRPRRWRQAMSIMSQVWHLYNVNLARLGAEGSAMWK